MAKYKVVGSQGVFDNAPGDEFVRDIPEDQEKFLVSIGALERVTKTHDPNPKEK